MKLTTTFWNDELLEFSQLLYINGKTNEIVFQTKLNDPYATYMFFNNLSQFMQTKLVHKGFDNLNNLDYYQFAVMHKNEITPIVWFDLYINENNIISHDHAFKTTMIKKNKVDISFGIFPQWTRKKSLPKYREFNIKSRAFKYVSNQIKKEIFL